MSVMRTRSAFGSQPAGAWLQGSRTMVLPSKPRTSVAWRTGVTVTGPLLAGKVSVTLGVGGATFSADGAALAGSVAAASWVATGVRSTVGRGGAFLSQAKSEIAIVTASSFRRMARIVRPDVRRVA